MFRRTAMARFEGPEYNRRRNQAIRQLVWNADGTLNIKGAAYYMWDWIGVPGKCCLGLVTSIYLYNGFIIRVEQDASKLTRECQDAHHEKIRTSGRLMSERHLVVQNRMIEDPDFPDNLPGFQEKYKSRITDDDEYARALATDERKYSH
jgi:hypothetical protein